MARADDWPPAAPHLLIIYEINRRFLEEVASRFPGDTARLQRMSIIDDSGEKQVRMAYLAIVAATRSMAFLPCTARS
jgi:glucan phosphorylase